MKIYEKYVLRHDCYIWICIFWLCPINNLIFDFSAASYYQHHQIIIKLIGWFCAAKLSTVSWASRNKVKKFFSHSVSNLESSIFNVDAMCLSCWPPNTPPPPQPPAHTQHTHRHTHHPSSPTSSASLNKCSAQWGFKRKPRSPSLTITTQHVKSCSNMPLQPSPAHTHSPPMCVCWRLRSDTQEKTWLGAKPVHQEMKYENC